MRRAFYLSLLYQCILTSVVCAFIILRTPGVTVTSFADRFHAWDARHYLYLATSGYTNIGDEGNLVVFFPLYPLLIRLNPLYLVSPVLSALTITFLSSVIGHMFLLRWLEITEQTKKHALSIFLLFCVSPISVYFSIIYTESLFLCLFSLFFYLLARKKYNFAIFIGMLASATKLIGVTLLIPFVFSVYHDVSFWPKRVRLFILACLGIPVGLLIFLGINYAQYGNPMQWKIIEEENWYKTSENPVAMYVQSAKSFRFSSLPTIWSDSFGTLNLDILITLIAPWILVAYLITHHTQDDIALTSFLAINFYIILSQSYWLSNTRYFGILFPLYIPLEALTRKHRFLFWIIVCLFVCLALLAIIKFSEGGWVF